MQEQKREDLGHLDTVILCNHGLDVLGSWISAQRSNVLDRHRCLQLDISDDHLGYTGRYYSRQGADKGIIPLLVWSGGPFIDFLKTRYLTQEHIQLVAIERIYFCQYQSDDQTLLVPIPLTKGEVFQGEHLSLADRRALMKFISRLQSGTIDLSVFKDNQLLKDLVRTILNLGAVSNLLENSNEFVPGNVFIKSLDSPFSADHDGEEQAFKESFVLAVLRRGPIEISEMLSRCSAVCTGSIQVMHPSNVQIKEDYNRGSFDYDSTTYEFTFDHVLSSQLDKSNPMYVHHTSITEVTEGRSSLILTSEHVYSLALDKERWTWSQHRPSLERFLSFHMKVNCNDWNIKTCYPITYQDTQVPFLFAL